MTREPAAVLLLGAVAAIAVSLVQCGGATRYRYIEPECPAATAARPGDAGMGSEVATDASADVATDAAIDAAARVGRAAASSDAVLRAGWLGAGSRLFVVSEHGAETVDAAAGGSAGAGAPRVERCALPPGASVIGISRDGRVALGLAGEAQAGEVALLDIARCALRRTGIRTAGLDPEVDRGAAGRLSDDGSRLVLPGDTETAARVFDPAAGRLLATCTTHAPAGGPEVGAGLSGDGTALVWRHGRDGTWVQLLAGCDRPPPVDVLHTPDPGALLSPHLRFLVDCPYRIFGTEIPVRGYAARALPGGRVVSHLVSGALADDDYGLCSGAPTAFSPDDQLLALADGGRVHVFALRDGRERVQIGEVTLRQTFGENPSGLAFSPAGDALAVWGGRRVVVFGLREYEAYARAAPATYEEETASLEKAVRAVVELGRE